MTDLAPYPARRFSALVDGVAFCSHCAATEDDLDPMDVRLRRVCPGCELGVLLTRSRDQVGDTFVVATADLRIRAASSQVQPFLGPPELLLGRPLDEVLSGDDLLRRTAACALGADGISTHRVTAAGRALIARVGACGMPPAALISLTED